MGQAKGQVNYRVHARDSLRSIYDFISKDSVQKAEEVSLLLADFIDRLVFFPTKYPECRELPTKKCLYRSAAFRKYRVIYKIVPQGIEIIEVFHTKRSPRSLARLRRVK